MKLKKLLASVTAAALAVTTMAVTSFTASADGEPTWTQASKNVTSDTLTATYKVTGSTVLPDNEYNAVCPKPTKIDIVSLIGGEVTKADIRSVKVVVSAEGGAAGAMVGVTEKLKDDPYYNSKYENLDVSDGTTGTYTLSTPSGITEDNAFELGVHWMNINTTITADITVKYEAPIPSSEIGKWIDVGSGVYMYTSEATGTDQWNAAAPGQHKVSFSDFLPTGKTLADIRKIEATLTTKGSSAGGSMGVTIQLADEPYSKWVQAAFDSDGKAVIDCPQGVCDEQQLQLQLDWINYSTTATITVTLTCAEGSDEPADPVIDTITLNAGVTGLEVDGTFQLIATVKDTEGNVMPDAEVTWISSDTSIATVDATGLVTGVAEGEVTITAKADATHTAECKFNVFTTPVTPTIMPANPSIKVGETVQMRVLSAEGKTIEWEVYDTSVATIDANGLVTAIAAGSTEIRAYLDGEGKDNGTFPYTMLTVTAADPVIPNPPVDPVDPNPPVDPVDPNPPVDPVDPNPPVDPTPDDPAHTHTPAAVWSSDAANHWHACSGCTEKLDLAAHTSDDGTVTTPATATTTGTKTYKCTVCGYVVKTETIPATGGSDTPAPAPAVPDHNYTGGVVIPVMNNNGTNGNTPAISGDSSKSGWDAIGEAILTAPEGDKIEVNMNGSTKVPSSIFSAVKDKDVDIVFNMGRGLKWTVNGLSVTKASNIDFDFSKNTRHIPDEVVDAAEGSYKKQLSLDHNGNFGFAAVMTYDIGARYNGSYANLFYYNPKSKELELIDCSLISGGKASFVLTHASDYLITITEEPLGDFEDVSAASGISSDSTDANAAVFAAVLAVITAAFGVVVYKKRRHN